MRTMVARSNNWIFSYPAKRKLSNNSNLICFSHQLTTCSFQFVDVSSRRHPHLNDDNSYSRTVATGYFRDHRPRLFLNRQCHRSHRRRTADRWLQRDQPEIAGEKMKTRGKLSWRLKLTPDRLEVIATIGAHEFVTGLRKKHLN